MDVDVLCLFPLCSLSQEALAHPRNLHAVTTRDAHWQTARDAQPVVHWPSIDIRVPGHKIRAGHEWNFTFSNQDDFGADVFLPTAAYYGDFIVTLWYAKPKDDSCGPALMISVDAERPSILFVRIIEASVVNGALAEGQKYLSTGDYHLRSPASIHIGPHSFQVGKVPSAPMDTPAVLHWRLHKIARDLHVEVQTDEWRDTGRRLGKGSSGPVDLVVGMLSGALRAMKTVTARPDNYWMMEQARGEGTMVAALNGLKDSNPHIIKYYGHRVDQHGQEQICRLYFQACHGDVYRLIQRKIAIAHFPLIVCHIGSAIMHLHRDWDAMHRDIKPQNMFFKIPLLDEDGNDGIHREQALAFIGSDSLELYLGDFGSSRPYSGYDFRSFCGSPQYAAPEVTIARSVYTKAADICSFGISLLEILDLDSVQAVYNRTVGASGWTTEAHDADPTYYHQYVRELQRMPTPSRIQPYLWAYLKKMVSFDPADRPTIDRVMYTLSDVEVLNANGGSVGDALVLNGDHYEAGPNLRVFVPPKE